MTLLLSAYLARHVITDWDVKPRSDDWEAVLKDS
jgi:hypothetical protein